MKTAQDRTSEGTEALVRQLVQAPMTEEEVRRIVREELHKIRTAERQVNAGRGPARW